MVTYFSKVLNTLEKKIDVIAVTTGLDISLMRRGLYPVPGPHHINLKKPGLNPFETDLNPETTQQQYVESARLLTLQNTLNEFIPHNNLNVRDYNGLLKNAKNNQRLLSKISGHEAAMTYSPDDYYTNNDFKISLYLNKELGNEKSLPFAIKLILLEQRLLDLRRYMEKNSIEPYDQVNVQNYTKELIHYAITHEKWNIVTQKIKAMDESKHKLGHKSLLKRRALNMRRISLENQEHLTQQQLSLEKKEKNRSEEELYYGQLAVYFLSDHTSEKSKESKNIRDWVDSHVEFEVYRTIFSHGVTTKDVSESKRYIDLALEYAMYSRPNCAFIEKIYTNKWKISSEILNNMVDGKVLLGMGKTKKKSHRLTINGKESKLISYEDFERNHLQDFSTLGASVDKKGNDYALTFNKEFFNSLIRPSEINADTSNYAKGFSPDITDFFNIDDNVNVVGSKTNTVSLYGMALFNAFFGGIIGAVRAVPGSIVRTITEYLNPKLALVDNELPMLAFSAKAGLKKMYKFNKDAFTDKLYDFNDVDIVAEKMANKIIENNTHFSSNYTLHALSEQHKIASMIEIRNGTDFIKNTLFTIGTMFALEKIVGEENLKNIPEYVYIVPTMFLATWASFSGLYEKLAYLCRDVAKTGYRFVVGPMKRKKDSLDMLL